MNFSINTITNYLDVIHKETDIEVKDKEENYLEPEIILMKLSNIWAGLSEAKKTRIAKAYMESFMEFYDKRKEYNELLTKTIKLSLASLIEPIENIVDEHIIYDYKIEKFMLASEATNKNLINCWHFRTFTRKTVEALYLLQKLNITKHTKLLEFLVQDIEFPEVYLELLQIKIIGTEN